MRQVEAKLEEPTPEGPAPSTAADFPGEDSSLRVGAALAAGSSAGCSSAGRLLLRRSSASGAPLSLPAGLRIPACTRMRCPFPVRLRDFLTLSHLLPLPVLCSNGSSSNGDASELPATAQTAVMITTLDVPRAGAVCGDAGAV